MPQAEARVLLGHSLKESIEDIAGELADDKTASERPG